VDEYLRGGSGILKGIDDTNEKSVSTGFYQGNGAKISDYKTKRKEKYLLNWW